MSSREVRARVCRVLAVSWPRARFMYYRYSRLTPSGHGYSTKQTTTEYHVLYVEYIAGQISRHIRSMYPIHHATATCHCHSLSHSGRFPSHRRWTRVMGARAAPNNVPTPCYVRNVRTSIRPQTLPEPRRANPWSSPSPSPYPNGRRRDRRYYVAQVWRAK